MKGASSSNRIHALRRRWSVRATRWLFGATHEGELAVLPMAGVFRILVCRVTHTLGNTLLLTPLIRELETVYPGAEIHILSRSPVAEDIFGRFVSVATIYRLPAWGFSHPLRVLRILRAMRRRPYDLVIDPDPRSQTDRVMTLIAKGRFKLGFANEHKPGAISHAVAHPASVRHVGQRPVALLRTALGRPDDNDFPYLDIRLSAAERAQGAEVLSRLTRGRSRTHGVIGVYGHASGMKLLDADWWKRFLDALEPRFPDQAFVEILPAFGRSMFGLRYPGYFSANIRSLATVLSGLSAYVSADCGVMHLAASCGVPAIGLFSSTDLGEWGPLGHGSCGIDMRGLSPEQVASRVADRLQAKRGTEEINLV